MAGIGCSSLLFACHDRATTLQVLRDVGIESVDLWSFPNWVEHVKLDSDEPERIAEEVKQMGLRVCALTLYTSDPQRLKKGVEFAYRLKAPIVVNGVQGRSWDEFEEFLRPAMDSLSQTGVKLAIENHTDNLLDSSDRAAEFCRRFPADLIGITFAPTHCFVIGERPNDWIHRFSDRILLLYLWDVSPRNCGLAWWRRNWNKFPEEQFPGNGALDFQAIADAIKVSGCKAEKVICLHGTESWSSDQLKSHLQTALKFLQSIGLSC
ncbi:MAG: sugar phosphate isomerase/epimerase [Armatimonadetes bacterium]|nr:sugar phosphate isomerase/epimerase [Armatimonadota bacterium]